MRFRRVDDLVHDNRLYLKCWVATLPESEAHCYGVLAAASLQSELYQPLQRGEVVDIPYEGKLYTEEQIVSGAWVRDF